MSGPSQVWPLACSIPAKAMTEKAILPVVSDSNFEAEVLNSALPVLVEFWADWCGACHIHAPMLEELAWRYRDRLKFFRIDLGENSKIAQAFGVRDLPTLLLFKCGSVVDHIVDLIPRYELTKKLESLLEGAQSID